MIDSRALKKTADIQLRRARQPEKIVIAYSAVIIALSAVITVAQYLLADQISQTGGLLHMGSRSFFSAIANFLPVLQMGLTLCLDFGFMAAMIRISRGQYASVNSLRTGFERFWPLLRCTLLKYAMIMVASVACIYLSVLLFVLSPFSDSFMAAVEPLLSNSSILSGGSVPVPDAATQQAILSSTASLWIIMALVCVVLVLPIVYRMRMANYVLYDHPEAGALYALRESRKMMRGNRIALFRVDLSFWWYYLLIASTAVVAYLDLILPMLGISLPLPETVAYFLFYFLSLGCNFAIFYFFKNKVETTYALAYNALKPREETGGVVLGNIFQM